MPRLARFAACLVLLSAAAPARAELEIEREEWRVVGWNDACSAALVHLAYPRFGQGAHEDPVLTRAGTLTIPPGSENSRSRWILDAYGPDTWDARALAGAERELKAAGYARAGYAETIPPGAASAGRLGELKSLGPRVAAGGEGLSLAAARYNPLSTCALLVFRREGPSPRYDFQLVRVYNPRARLERASAHADEAQRLFADGDLEGALAEAATAAALSPESPGARYRHAALLCLSGRLDEAVAELWACAKLDPARARRAREDADFESLRPRQDFQRLAR